MTDKINFVREIKLLLRLQIMHPRECKIAKPTEEFKCIAKHHSFMCT